MQGQIAAKRWPPWPGRNAMLQLAIERKIIFYKLLLFKRQSEQAAILQTSSRSAASQFIEHQQRMSSRQQLLTKSLVEEATVCRVISILRKLVLDYLLPTAYMDHSCPIASSHMDWITRLESKLK